MDIIDINKEIERDNKKDVLIFNPLNKDFIWKYDGKPYTIPSKENKKYPTYLANHLGKHLIDAYMDTKGENYEMSKARRIIFND